MFEHRQQPLLPRRKYYFRIVRSLGLGGAIVAISLGVGMAGFHAAENMSWLDAFLNASMLLSGEGPVAPFTTPSGKLFAGCYAIFCGIVVITTAAVIFSPVAHRAFHRFHLAEDREA